MFAERLRQLRKQKKWSQKALGNLLHVSQQTIGKWEKGSASPDPEMLSEIADVFGTSTDYLLGRDEYDVAIDDFVYAMDNETKDLSEESKQQLLQLARFLKNQEGK